MPCIQVLPCRRGRGAEDPARLRGSAITAMSSACPRATRAWCFTAADGAVLHGDAGRVPGRLVGGHAAACRPARQSGVRRRGATRASTTVDDPGLQPRLSFDPDDDVAAPFIHRGARPPLAVLREQGVNGQIEMAAAFDQAGFDCVDVHMSDIIAGRVTLGAVQGAGGLRRLLLRRRARRRRGLGQVHPVQPARPRPVRGLLRATGHLRPRRVQRLPDDVEPARADPGCGALAALRAQPLRAVRGAVSSWWRSPTRRRSCSAGHGRLASAHRGRPRRGPRRVRRRRISWMPRDPSSRCATWRTTAPRRALSGQSQRLARGHHRADHRATAG